MKKYIKKEAQPMEPWHQGLDMEGVSISTADLLNGSPKKGDMIAVNPNNVNDKWLVAKKFFEENYTLAPGEEEESTEPHVMKPIIEAKEDIDPATDGVAIKGDS